MKNDLYEEEGVAERTETVKRHGQVTWKVSELKRLFEWFNTLFGIETHDRKFNLKYALKAIESCRWFRNSTWKGCTKKCVYRSF